LSGPTTPVPGTPGTAGGRPLSLSEKLKGQPDKVQTLQEYTPPNENIPTVNVEDLPKTPQAPAAPTQAVKDVQDQLNQLLIPTGTIAPLKLDGLLGDNTRKAMKAFQVKFNLPPTPANIKATLLKEHNLGLETKAPF
jgi:hypothetical protein